ncbi:FadR family transcriptional regulator [Rhodococcus sp. PAMC28707]|uniref:FadR/GntR family transcriptional regulator n=1 Tax=unclassified Rhodococcus (in: high G+C Gram-positive bacteria) TaxID=192944 RepID=UPI00109DF7BB|nr:MULTISPECIES: FCD domain-containing protein [unclassified Rhodococcus (in: high G+C Gram-positive bacteria)]QCB51769.1 FadR family transcriptional regulator [Rhodococcus sp. PAMC28705]QCB60063.1 FadR family transcriptional regulator [Rhodococcus sp. PAMC28707]
MKPVPALTRAHVLADELEKQILGREFAPGELIGTIESLKEQSGFARSTVAEAIRLLTDRGLAEIRPGRGGGLFATAAGPMVRIRHTLLAVTDEPASVAEAVAVREALEPLIDVDAAKHRTAADSADMATLLVWLANAAAKGTSEFLVANWNLHERIARISPNRTASALYLSMTRFVRDHALTAVHDENSESAAEWLHSRLAVHEELVAAIIAGDLPRVKAATDKHAESAAED